MPGQDNRAVQRKSESAGLKSNRPIKAMAFVGTASRGFGRSTDVERRRA
jgi:hypothetical protein